MREKTGPYINQNFKKFLSIISNEVMTMEQIKVYTKDVIIFVEGFDECDFLVNSS